MGFVGDDHDIPAVGEGRHALAFLLGHELLDGRKHDTAAADLEEVSQLVAAIRLLGLLADDLKAAVELAEELVVEIIAVGQDDDGRVLHGWVLGDSSGVEEHREALARTLGVPDDPRLTIAGLGAGSNGFLHSLIYGVELVVARDDLGRAALVIILVGDEVAD